MNDTPRATAAPGPACAPEMHAGEMNQLMANLPRSGSGKLGEELAARIENDIMRLGWPVGHVLGSEAELLERYGVSRAVFREAVRLLEHHMVARMRPGPGGGLITARPNSEAVARAMALYLSFERVEPWQLLQVRNILEAHAAELAAVRASDQERRELRAFLADEVEKVESKVGYGNVFHLQIGKMANNPVLELFIRCLIDLTEQRTIPQGSRKEVAQNTHHAHVKVAEAIISGDASLARYRMSSHVRAIAPFIGDPPAPPPEDQDTGGPEVVL